MNDRPLYLDFCSKDAARRACKRWHYTGSVPPGARVFIGAWEHGRYVGTVVYGKGAGQATNGKRYGLANKNEMAELNRVALSPEKESHTSEILAYSIKMVKRSNPGIRLLISFADEMEQGHHGGIYQASNWVYTGVSSGLCGYVVNGRRTHLRAWTSPNKKLPEGSTPYKGRKHRYLYPLDDEMAERIRPLSKPYPKRARSDTSDTVAVQATEGGAAPTRALSSPARAG